MKKQKTGFLKDENGKTSYMRVASLLTLLFIFGFDFYYASEAFEKLTILKGILDINFIFFNLIFLIAGFFPKYLQKFIEKGIYLKWMKGNTDMRQNVKDENK